MSMPETDQWIMSKRDEWIMSNTASTMKELYKTRKCHLDEAIVFIAYLNGEITPETAAKEITIPSTVFGNAIPLMNLLVDALINLDEDGDTIIVLLAAIQNLPSTWPIHWWQLFAFGRIWRLRYRAHLDTDPKDLAFFTKMATLEAKMYLLDIYPIGDLWFYDRMNLVCVYYHDMEVFTCEIHAWLVIAGKKIAERLQPGQIKSFARAVIGRKDKIYDIQATMYEHWEHWKKRFLQHSYDEENLSAGTREVLRKCYEILKGLVVNPPNPPEDS